MDVNAADPEGLWAISRFFATQGVTGWQCSILIPDGDAARHRWPLPSSRFPADLVLADKDLAVLATFVGGREVYRR